jgi:hypothetical protein
MATVATANVKGGLFGDGYALTQLASIDGKGSARNWASKWLKSYSLMSLRARMKALDGVVAGSNATKTLGLIDATTSELGGKRIVANQTFVNRNTTAGDVTEINKDIFDWSALSTFGATPPINKDLSPLGEKR